MGDEDTLPVEYLQYWPLIEACQLPLAEIGKVGYLTIHESEVRAGQAQRRPGLHCESPGSVLNESGQYTNDRIDWGCGIVRGDRSTVRGGIYMASNVPNSSRLWDIKVRSPVVGKLGDLEHLRDLLGDGKVLEADKMYWLTDATPHESLRLSSSTHRQFFRLVTSSLSAWYPEHSTPNPRGVIPDPKITRVVHGDKFAG
jgi:hypothetical protein